jgi:hypothetical protein
MVGVLLITRNSTLVELVVYFSQEIYQFCELFLAHAEIIVVPDAFKEL